MIIRKNIIKVISFILLMTGLMQTNAQDYNHNYGNDKVLTDTIPPAVPQGLKQYTFEKHMEIDWLPNQEADIAGYNIYRYNGSEYILHTVIPKDQNFFNKWLGSTGVFDSYKISAYDLSGNESALTDSVSGTTHAMSDDEFLTMVQLATFHYFWDYAHPVSGLARERLGSGNTCAIGGSGFGVMAILVGIERGFITRELGVDRMLKILNFLNNQADRFHGAFPHWINGETGAVIPFSQFDDGGDLVETSFMIQGLLTARQFFNQSNSNETEIRNLITSIWETVEWNWYQRAPFSDFLYWHWSPNYGWQINMKIVGYNETMITYLLAIASQTHHVPARLYYDGWASSSNYENGNTYFGYHLWVGPPYGGPLFFAHYSFLGFDPRFKKDIYTNYFFNNKNHTLINRQYCINNPFGYEGYGENMWGLTASDDPFGYRVHEPYNDNGTITPSAALSSMPYTPEESLGVIKEMYRTLGSQVWGKYGFKDAFNLHENWFASSYIAIDQGPIIDMIENYRSQLLWNNFMANPEIQAMVDSVGFMPDSATAVTDTDLKVNSYKLLGNYPNPFNPTTVIEFSIPSEENISIKIYDELGRLVKNLTDEEMNAGIHKIFWDGRDENNSEVSFGIYIYTIKINSKILTGKMVLQK